MSTCPEKREEGCAGPNEGTFSSESHLHLHNRAKQARKIRRNETVKIDE